ncbi:MAG: GatB/YqeY domain-containing protein [Actinomycetota bacterium]|nr:GatB/YqeY domain-containing protein [Actinomycetota bacterium]MDP9484269.1 GatB/YqeY domain-containing protein [Actinomycetota bacterium]
MRDRDKGRVTALRMISAALKNAEIEKGQPLNDDEEMAVLRRQVKQREESAEAYRKAGREEQAEAETREAEMVRVYLPTPLSDEELEALVDQAIAETGATSMREMGAVMGRANAVAAGRADGRKLSGVVRSRLQG